jgi:poly(A) polymerase
LSQFGFLSDLKSAFPRAEIFLVGGAVRDLFFGRETKDFDFVVRQVAANDLEVFLKKYGEVNLVGRSFSVFKFMPKDWDPHNPIDVALPRREHALGTGGYRDFEVQGDPKLSIKDDLSRRDFTINAVALKIEIKKEGPRFNKIIDPFKGIKDLQKKSIKAVGKPEVRFQEDYSRMLRALRFACQLDFTIEKKTWQAIQKNIYHLNDIQRNVQMITDGRFTEPDVVEQRAVPYEVMAKELMKSFIASPVRAFDFYDQSGAFAELMPETLKMKNCPQPTNWHSEGDVWVHSRLALEKLFSSQFKEQFGDEPPSPELIMAVLLHDLGKPYTIKTPEKDGTDRIRFDEHDVRGAEMAKQICQRLRLSSPDEFGLNADYVSWLIQHHMLLVQGEIDKMRPSTIEKYFFNPKVPGRDLLKLSFVDIGATIPSEGEPDFTQFRQMTGRIEELKQLSASHQDLPKPILSGSEIMEDLGLKPGPQIGSLLALIREEQLSGKIKDKEEAIRFLQKQIHKK